MNTTKNQAESARQAVSDMLAATDVQHVWQIFSTALEKLGMQNLIYGATRIPTWGILGDGQDALILYHGPQSYVDVYVGEDLYQSSATYEWAERNKGFASWVDAVSQSKAPPSPEQLRILQLNIDHNCLAGFVGSLNHVVPGMRGVIGMSPGRGILQPQADAMWADVRADAEMLCELMHLRISALPQTDLRRPLTSRQREVLHWSAQGKTMQDVATIMNLSIATVEKHLSLARAALDAQTTAHAVQKATALKLLADVGPRA